MNMGNLSLGDAKLKHTREYPRKVLCSLGPGMDCREKAHQRAWGQDKEVKAPSWDPQGPQIGQSEKLSQ